MYNAFSIIFVLSIIFFIILSIIRIVSYHILKNIIKQYKDLKLKFNTKSTKNNKGEDEKLRDKEKEKKLAKVVVMNQEIDINTPQIEQVKIVGIVKPIGRWTKLILGQKVGYMMQQANALKQQSGQGYWQTMINSHDTRKSKGHGR